MRARLGVAAVGVIFLAWGLQSLWLEIPDAASMALAAVGATLVLLSTVPSVVGAAKALFRSGGPDVDARRELTGSDRDPDLLSPRVVLIPGRRENDSGFEIINHTGDEIRQLGVSLVSLVRLSGGARAMSRRTRASHRCCWNGRARSARLRMSSTAARSGYSNRNLGSSSCAAVRVHGYRWRCRIPSPDGRSRRPAGGPGDSR